MKGKKWYEFQLGFYIEAETDAEAMHEAGKVLDVAHDVDVENDAQIELIHVWPQFGPSAGKGFVNPNRVKPTGPGHVTGIEENR